MLSIFPFFVYFILGATIASFSLYRRTQLRYLRIFFPFLIFVSLVEIVGAITKAYDIHNHWIYNIYIIVEFCALLYVYYHALTARVIQRIILGFSVLFVPFAFLNFFFLESPTKFNTYTYVAGGVFTVLMTMLYFWQMLKKDLSVSFVYDPMFWVSVALLFFYLGCMPFFVAFNYLNVTDEDWAQKYYIIYQVLIALRYTLFAIGFLWKKTGY